MAELKTKKTTVSVDSFIKTIKEEQKRKDAIAIAALFKRAIKSEGRMWGGSIIGFGDYTYKYPNGKEMEWFMAGFSPRKANFALYLMGPKEGKHAELLKKLGKHETSKGCLYIKKMEDVDPKVLTQLLDNCVKHCKSSK
jgi:hypothetical protein